MTAIVIAAVSVVAIAGASERDAAAERIALLSDDAELARATTTALAAWNVEVVAVTEPGPGATMPEVTDRAAALAAAHTARAVVWIAPTAGKPTLWVHDAATRRAVAVPLPMAPPFDEPTAAAVALTIKTLLRYGDVAPVDERYRVPARADNRFALEARAGSCARPDPAPRWEPRFGLAALYRPGRDLWWLVLGVRAGRGLAIEQPDFVGRYNDSALALGAQLELAIAPRLAVVPRLGASLHWVSLDGSSLSRMEGGRVDHLDPAVDVGVELELRVVARLRLVVVTEGSYLLRRQRFLSGSEVLFDIPAVTAELGLAVRVPL